MASFTTRVELHERSQTQKPGSEDYLKLHTEMEARGYTRTLVIGGTKQPLPTAEYSLIADVTIEEAGNRAKAAVKAVKWPATVLVTEAKGTRTLTQVA